MISTLAVIASLVLNSSAAPGRHAAPVDSTDQAVVVVENSRAVPVTIYAERGSFDVKLGVVQPMADTTIAIPDYLLGDDLRLFAEPRGQLEESTDLLDVEPGERIGLVIRAR